ncbi:MAG: nitroreductase family protein [Candidatus Altiarchaeota archaeon]
MKFLELAKSRRSVRKYKESPVPRVLLEKIVEAGMWAPSGLNTQPWRFIIVDEPKLKSETRRLYDEARTRKDLYKQDSSFLENASLILVCADASKAGGEFSTAMACQNMLLAATDLALGSLITAGMMDNVGVKELNKLFTIKEPYKPVALLAFGFANGTPDPKPRKKLEEFVSHNRF